MSEPRRGGRTGRQAAGVALAILPLLLTACGGPPHPGPVLQAARTALGQGPYRVSAVSRFQIQGTGYSETLTLQRQGNSVRGTVAGPGGRLLLVGNGKQAVTVNVKSGVRLPAVLSSGALLPSGADVGLVVLTHLRALFRQSGAASLPGGSVGNRTVDRLFWKPGPSGFYGIGVSGITAAVDTSSHLPVEIRLAESSGLVVTLRITGYRTVRHLPAPLFRLP